ncbi:MAG: hypothetical protein H7Y00_10885 [Fimbriimonadaceae bacterium]|nr:hypothetical protein [Chitinophagales bacterium]
MNRFFEIIYSSRRTILLCSVILLIVTEAIFFIYDISGSEYNIILGAGLFFCFMILLVLLNVFLRKKESVEENEIIPEKKESKNDDLHERYKPEVIKENVVTGIEKEIIIEVEQPVQIHTDEIKISEPINTSVEIIENILPPEEINTIIVDLSAQEKRPEEIIPELEIQTEMVIREQKLNEQELQENTIPEEPILTNTHENIMEDAGQLNTIIHEFTHELKLKNELSEADVLKYLVEKIEKTFDEFSIIIYGSGTRQLYMGAEAIGIHIDRIANFYNDQDQFKGELTRYDMQLLSLIDFADTTIRKVEKFEPSNIYLKEQLIQLIKLIYSTKLFVMLEKYDELFSKVEHAPAAKTIEQISDKMKEVKMSMLMLEK